MITYVLHLVGAVAGVTSIIALILNYARRGQYGPPLDSHHRWIWYVYRHVRGLIALANGEPMRS